MAVAESDSDDAWQRCGPRLRRCSRQAGEGQAAAGVRRAAWPMHRVLLGSSSPRDAAGRCFRALPAADDASGSGAMVLGQIYHSYEPSDVLLPLVDNAAARWNGKRL